MSLGLGLGLARVRNAPVGVGEGLNPLTRYITELSAAGSMYDQFSSPIVLDGDFEWEIQYFGNSEDYAPLIGSTLGNDQIARIQPGGVLRAISSGGNVTGSTVITTGKSYLLGGKRAGSTLSVLVNGTEENSFTNASVLGTLTIDSIMAHSGVHADGGWLNLKIWTGGDRTTGTLIVDAAKDEDGSANVVGNEVTVLGTEESQNTFVSIDTTDAYTDFEVTSTLSPSKTYLITVDVQSRESGGFKINTATTDSSQIFTSSVTELIVTGTTFSSMQTGVAGFTGVAKISTREIPATTPLLTRINQTTDEVTQYTVTEDGYLGPNLWELPAYTFTGSEVSSDIPQTSNVLTIDNTYATSFSGGGANVGVTTGTGGATRALIGNVSSFADGNPFTVVSTAKAQSVTARWQVLGTPPFSGQVSIDYIKRLIEVA